MTRVGGEYSETYILKSKMNESTVVGMGDNDREYCWDLE